MAWKSVKRVTYVKHIDWPGKRQNLQLCYSFPSLQPKSKPWKVIIYHILHFTHCLLNALDNTKALLLLKIPHQHSLHKLQLQMQLTQMNSKFITAGYVSEVLLLWWDRVWLSLITGTETEALRRRNLGGWNGLAGIQGVCIIHNTFLPVLESRSQHTVLSDWYVTKRNTV